MLARVAVLLAVAVPGVAAAAPAAWAGQWVQVSCVNPNGSGAPSEGWSSGTSGPASPWDITSTRCSPGSPLSAELYAAGAAPAMAAAYLAYTPPAGSKLVGGTANVTLSADGYGKDSSGNISAVAYARLYTPDLSNSGSNVFVQCVAWLANCPNGSLDYTGTVNIPADQGGGFYAEAACSSTTGSSCNLNAHNNVWALTAVNQADLLLSSSTSPLGSGFSGAGLGPVVRGTAHVLFTASESSGPGIYSASTAIDGQTVSTTYPNANGGDCVPVGTGPGGALMFDYQQPCLTSEQVAVPVPTKHLSNGHHDLTITVTDAAGNTSTVLDQAITSSNAQKTPRPHGVRSIRAQFVIYWSWKRGTTVLRRIAVNHLPHAAGVGVACTGRRCPRLAPAQANAPQIAGLLRGLRGHRFHPGEQLHFDVTERRHRPERIVITFHYGREPGARLGR